MQKRGAEDDGYDESQPNKRSKNEESTELAVLQQTSSALTVKSDQVPRTSNLLAPNMLLNGHEGAVYSLAFDSSGQCMASCSADRQILLWDVYGECKNYNVLSGHKNAILEVKWDGDKLLSCSADKTVALWDANKGTRIRKYTDHKGIVNSCALASHTSGLSCSGSDDSSVLVWDARSRKYIQSIPHDYQVTSVCMSADGYTVFSGGIDNTLRQWDLRMDDPTQPVLSLTQQGMDTITCLSLNAAGTHVLCNSMDSGLRSWDVRPYFEGTGAEDERCERFYQGHRHGAEKVLLKCAWSPNGARVAAGSADRLVHIWDTDSTKELYCLPGHKGSVNEVLFHPTEPIIASCGSDKQIFLGEL